VLLRLARALAASLFACSGILVSAPLAEAATSAPTGSTGYDISYPQCGGSPPTDVGFGVVGVNDGHPFSANPCLARELGWASRLVNGAPSFYMNTANPGPAFTSNWPTGQSSPQICLGANSVPCSYDYGWNAARSSLGNAIAAESANGALAPGQAAVAAHWWLDVETGNQWETLEPGYDPSATSDLNDQAMLQGSIAFLSSVGVAFVGIYSTDLQWGKITGGTDSTFQTSQVWVPGSGDLANAQAACLGPSFTGGRVAMTQYPSNRLDGDYLCPLASAPTSASTTPTSSAAFTTQLAVTGDPGPVTYVQTGGAPSLLVSSSGVVTTGGPLTAGTYTASGTSSDQFGDQGTFTFTLQVGLITQVAPTSFPSTVAGSSTYTNQLGASGNGGPVTYVQTGGAPSLLVSSSGVVTTGGPLTAGTYTASGTSSDQFGDQGTFTFTLVVGVITQNLPTQASTTTTLSSTFAQQLATRGNIGVVTYAQTTGAPSLLVSPTGLVSSASPLAAGSYVVRGTTTDSGGDTGRFFFNLLVTTPPVIPHAIRVIGHAVAGRTVTLSIPGTGFFGRPVVTSHSGTTTLVTHDTGTRLDVLVSVRPRSRSGVFTFTLTFPNGRQCRVRYNQR